MEVSKRSHGSSDGCQAGAELPAPWLNLPKLWEFCQDIVEAFDTIETKEEFEDLIWSWNNYVNALNRWFFVVFPWEHGLNFRAALRLTSKRWLPS